jgi:hemerythrin-like domain-containing protein
MDTPDLTTYYVIHRNMRVSTRRLAAAVADVTEADRAERGHALRRWYAGFEDELHTHHTVEDTIFFPSLFERLPSLRAYLARIDDEHDELNRLLERTHDALAAVANSNRDWTESIASARNVTSDLESLIDQHLDFEDAEILPLFSRHYSRADYEALDKEAIAGTGMKQLAYTVPWLMAGATPDEQTQMLDNAPFILRVLWMATRRRYARLETDALGPIPSPVPCAA